MLDNQQVTNKKPQDLAVTKSQGTIIRNGNGNSTPMLRDSKCRYEKGMGLYKSGRVSIGSNGFFKVSGFEVDTEKVQCECPDYKSRKEACKHLFAAMLFVKNRGKQIVEDLPGFTWADEVRDMQPKTKDKVQTFAQLWEAENVPSLGQNGANVGTTKDKVSTLTQGNKPKEAPAKSFARQSTITRLAVLNTATEIIKTWGKPIEFAVVVSLASQLKQWALGN